MFFNYVINPYSGLAIDPLTFNINYFNIQHIPLPVATYTLYLKSKHNTVLAICCYIIETDDDGWSLSFQLTGITIYTLYKVQPKFFTRYNLRRLRFYHGSMPQNQS